MTCFTAGLFNHPARVRRLRLTSTDELRRIVAAHGGSMACYYKTSTLLTALFSVLIGMMGFGMISMPIGDLAKAKEVRRPKPTADTDLLRNGERLLHTPTPRALSRSSRA